MLCSKGKGGLGGPVAFLGLGAIPQGDSTLLITGGGCPQSVPMETGGGWEGDGLECSLPAGRAAVGAGMRWLRVSAPKPGGSWVREGCEHIMEPLRAQPSTQMQSKP